MKVSSSDIASREWLQLLIEKAPQLRRAGVLELSADRVVFAPYEQPVAQAPEMGAGDESPETWDEAISLGMAPGTKIPEFGRRVSATDDE